MDKTPEQRMDNLVKRMILATPFLGTGDFSWQIREWRKEIAEIERDMKVPNCEICGQPMPEGEEIFTFHGYSGNCPESPADRQKKGLQNPSRSSGEADK